MAPDVHCAALDRVLLWIVTGICSINPRCPEILIFTGNEDNEVFIATILRQLLVLGGGFVESPDLDRFHDVLQRGNPGV